MDEVEVEAPQHGATLPVASSTANDVSTQEVEPTASAKPKSRTRGKSSTVKPKGTEVYICFTSTKVVTKHFEHIASRAV